MAMMWKQKQIKRSAPGASGASYSDSGAKYPLLARPCPPYRGEGRASVSLDSSNGGALGRANLLDGLTAAEVWKLVEAERQVRDWNRSLADVRIPWDRKHGLTRRFLFRGKG